jgi:two-component system sensor histidine kinase KdpD
MTPEERRRLLSDIYAESIWLNRFVENMLSMTRIDDHLLKLQTSSELVEELVGEAVNLARRRIAHLLVDVATPDEPVLVDVDSSLIEEVLLNLIENAASHTPIGERIDLRVRVEGGLALFSVRDRGPGIRPDEIGRVFERYFVGTEPRTDSKRGQGIGLSICRTIVQAHGGELTAANHPEGGAVFEFSLPVRKEEARARRPSS